MQVIGSNKEEMYEVGHNITRSPLSRKREDNIYIKLLYQPREQLFIYVHDILAQFFYFFRESVGYLKKTP